MPSKGPRGEGVATTSRVAVVPGQELDRFVRYRLPTPPRFAAEATESCASLQVITGVTLALLQHRMVMRPKERCQTYGDITHYSGPRAARSDYPHRKNETDARASGEVVPGHSKTGMSDCDPASSLRTRGQGVTLVYG